MTLKHLFLAAIPAAALWLAPSDALANVPSCGGLDLTKDSSCELQTSGGCTASCTPINFVAQCDVTLAAQCDATCTPPALDVSCTGSCEASCNTSCTGNASFDCSADCEGTCEADCSSECSTRSGDTNCTSECKAHCSGTCSAKCTGTLPDCNTKCQASCQGSCTAKVTGGCNIDCQAKATGGCTASLTGGCTAQCSAPKGALFCDGQYVDVGGDLQSCLDDLVNDLHIKVSGYADSSCSGDTCTAEAGGSASCSASPNAAPVAPAFALVGVLGLTLARSVRRRRRGTQDVHS